LPRQQTSTIPCRPHKGTKSRNDPGAYRPIALLDHAFKLLELLLLARLHAITWASERTAALGCGASSGAPRLAMCAPLRPVGSIAGDVHAEGSVGVRCYAGERPLACSKKACSCAVAQRPKALVAEFYRFYT